ncbi:Uncharacterised protein [uncultured archaeon]|nr:Uncharacterised protein [uncultured archaeon]
MPGRSSSTLAFLVAFSLFSSFSTISITISASFLAMIITTHEYYIIYCCAIFWLRNTSNLILPILRV